jgi:hypothetical protein
VADVAIVRALDGVEADGKPPADPDAITAYRSGNSAGLGQCREIQTGTLLKGAVMENMEIQTSLRELQRERPVFHSEADFQHALAWTFHIPHPSASVRLETNSGSTDRTEHIDILIRDNGTLCAVELKYKTARLDAVHNGERFHLQNHGAQPLGRYDFIKDIVRLESFVTRHSNAMAYAMFLTKEATYWSETRASLTTDVMFRLHQGRTLDGVLSWGTTTGTGTMKGRESPLSLIGSHSILWLDYSQLDGRGAGRFRYVLLKILPGDITRLLE